MFCCVRKLIKLRVVRAIGLELVQRLFLGRCYVIEAQQMGSIANAAVLQHIDCRICVRLVKGGCHRQLVGWLD